MVDVREMLEEMSEARTEELREFFGVIDDNKRQRMSDNIAVYDRLMQGIETLGEQCEVWELMEDGEEKSRKLVSYSENLRTIASLAQARSNLVRLMMQNE